MDTPGFDAVRRLRSYVSLEENIHVGDHVQKTVDLFTVTGMAVLIHSDPNVLAADVSLIRKMEVEGGLFRFESCAHGEPPSPREPLRAVLGFLPPCFEFLLSSKLALSELSQEKK